MKKGRIKNLLRNLMLSLIIIVPSVVFATTSKGDVIEPVHSTGTNNCTISGKGCNPGDVAFEKEVSKVEKEDGVYEISLKVKGEDITKEVEGNTHDIYIAVVFDISYSMKDVANKYKNAKDGAKYFAKKILEKNKNANLALITFGQNVNIARDFSNKDFDSAPFPDENRLEFATNMQGGIKEAHELLMSKRKNGTEELYMVIIGDGLPNYDSNNRYPFGGNNDYDIESIEESINNATAAKNDNIEIFSIGYELSVKGKEVLSQIAGIKKDENNDDLGKENFVEAKVDTILKKFDKIANKITKTFYAGTDVKISDTIGDNFEYVDGSSKLIYTYNGNYDSSITPKITNNGKTLTFELEEIMEIVQTIKFQIKINENTTKKLNETNKIASVSYKDSDNVDQSLEIKDTAKVYWTQPEYGYKINYCKENIDNCFHADDDDKNVATIGTEIKAEVDEYLPTGYKIKEGIQTSMIIEDSDNILNIIYVRDDSQKKTLSYTVEYYKDNVKADTVPYSKEVWAGIESNIIEVNVENIYKVDKYPGYKIITEKESIPTSVETGDVIKIYYEKDESQTKTLSYTVEYYTDGVLVDTDPYSKEVWAGIESNIIEVNVENIYKVDKYPGYKIITEKESIPTSVETGDVIKIYYEKDESQTKTLSYTVKYYTDGVLVDTVPHSKEVWAGIESDYITVLSIDKSDKRYTGYKFGYTDPEIIPTSVLTGTTINVYYVKDINWIKKLTYTIKFYTDGVEVKEDRILKEKFVWINDSDIIDIKDFNMSEDKYTGYKLVSSKESIPTSVKSGDTINVYYEKDSFEYTVEYYYDGKLDEEKTEVISALYGTEITEVEDKSYDNYLLSKIENLPLVIDTEDNIIKVYYVESGIGGDIIEPPKTGNNSYLNILLVLISLLIIKLK